MSFDEDFSRAYHHTVEQQPLPSHLAERTLQVVREAKAPIQPRRWKRPALVGACLAAAVVVALAVPAMLASLEGLNQGAMIQDDMSGFGSGDPASATSVDSDAADASTHSQEPETTRTDSGIYVRAYADDGSELADELFDDYWGVPLIEGEDPAALFFLSGASGSGADTVWPEGDSAVTVAFFRPETFTVEGSNIQRVQIHVSRDELYLQTVDKDVAGIYEVDFWGLDPRQRGERLGYEDCDALGSFSYLGEDEDGKPWRREDVFRLKRMGSVIDIDKAEDDRVGTPDLQFGILTMATTEIDNLLTGTPGGYSVPQELGLTEGDIDGVQLNITVTYDDGTCETQVIDMHRKLVLADEVTCQPLAPLQFVERPEAAHGRTVLELVYGTIASKTSESFPYADEPANVYADKVMPPMPASPSS